MTSDKSPTTDELRERVEATREELGRTVAALTAKTDVKGRLMDRAGRAGAKAHGAASGSASWSGRRHRNPPGTRP